MVTMVTFFTISARANSIVIETAKNTQIFMNPLENLLCRPKVQVARASGPHKYTADTTAIYTGSAPPETRG